MVTGWTLLSSCCCCLLVVLMVLVVLGVLVVLVGGILVAGLASATDAVTWMRGVEGCLCTVMFVS